MRPTPKALQLVLGRCRVLTGVADKLEHHLALTVLALKDITVDPVIRAEGVDLVPVLARLAVLRRVPAVSFPVLLVAEEDALVAGPAFAEVGVGVRPGALRAVDRAVGVEVFEGDDLFRRRGRVLCYHAAGGQGEEGQDDGWGGEVHGDLLVCLSVVLVLVLVL